MRERLSRMANSLVKRHSVPFLENLRAYLRTLSSGDTCIVAVLGTILLISSLAGLYALERSFLVEVPSHGGTLTEGVLGSPRFVNPLLSLSDADRDLSLLTYAGLMGVGGDGLVVPVLAESYSVSEDGKTYTFILREDAKFHDGSPVTAEDVVFTVEKAQDPGLKSPELANWANIRAEAVDARTVQFTLPKPYAPFLDDATLGILPAHLWRTVTNEEFPFSPLMQDPVGAGPFKVSKIVRDKNGIIERYELKAFDDYALGRPFLDSLRFVFFAQEADLKEAYERGRVESAHGIASDTAIRAPYARVFGVFFNPNQNPMFARLEVRKALSLTLDRNSVIQDVLGGYATAIEGPVPPGSGVELPALEGTNEERAVNAREILDEGGWDFDEEAGLWKQEKEKLELTVTLKTSNVPELKAVAGAVKAQWEAFGVPVSVEFYEPGDLTSSVIRPRQYEALLFGMVVGREHDLYAFWESSQRNDPGLNIAMYANPNVDDLLEEVREESDAEKVAVGLGRINTLIAADYPAAFIHAPDFLYAVPKDIEGIVLSQVGAPSDRFASVAFWHRHSEWVWPFLVNDK